MAVTAPAPRVVQVAIDAPAERVYGFAADPANLPRWAPNFARSARRAGDGWIVETDDGPVALRFAPPNDFGVLDHWVRPPNADEVYSPMRVLAHGAGSVIAFTLLPQADWSAERMDGDETLVRADLERLKSILEADSARA